MEVLLGIALVALAASLAGNAWQFTHHRPKKHDKTTTDEVAAKMYVTAIGGIALGKLTEEENDRFQNNDETVLTDKINEILDKTIPGHRQLRLEIEGHELAARKSAALSNMYARLNPHTAAVGENLRVMAQNQADAKRAQLNSLYAAEWRKQPQTAAN